ncbi:hypothetical protein NDU88_003409 [Pleurodeles waltl]|uniref:Uncharacterized protein n=1 Tax=Pleurodeles waltl TaxID=8319 RepID=A0AAV7KVG2_PLEWA|nr:hypothetical protein NDU88_003409 [Pleurodeles waltl]
MPRKGAKAAFSAARGKPIRTNFWKTKKQEGALGETGMVASLDISEQPGFIGTGLESHLQEGLEGSRDAISDDTLQLKNPCDTLPQIYHITENHADLINNRRADKALTQPENVQQRPPIVAGVA